MNKYIAELYGTFLLVLSIIGTHLMVDSFGAPPFIQLLCIALVVALVLLSNITIFSKVSGAHFNPAVSLVMLLNKELSIKEFLFFISFQSIGGLLGVILANTMFGLDFIQISDNDRSGFNIYLSEFIATFGLIITILGVRRLSTVAIGPAVGLYISAGYWFTSSTSFANPVVTLSRGFTDTFTGISPEFILPFILFQLMGAVVAMLFMNFLENE